MMSLKRIRMSTIQNKSWKKETHVTLPPVTLSTEHAWAGKILTVIISLHNIRQLHIFLTSLLAIL